MWSLLPTKHNFDLASYRCAKDVDPREVPLPLLNHFVIGDETYAAQYHGHGQTKMAFKLMSSSGGALDGCVLKVECPSREDPEFDTMHHWNKFDGGICVPIIRARGTCQRRMHQNCALGFVDAQHLLMFSLPKNELCEKDVC
jgi:hypothetical protein